MASIDKLYLGTSTCFSIVNFYFNLTLKQLDKVDEALPKINVFKQYYVQAETCLLLRVNCDVAVTWRIPLPYRSPFLEVSAIFPLEKFNDICRNARDLWSCV